MAKSETQARDAVLVKYLNEAFGKAVGADAYCRDAAIAVETAKALIAAKRAARVTAAA